MEKPNSFMWQHRTLLTILAAVGSFAVGLMVPLQQTFKPGGAVHTSVSVLHNRYRNNPSDAQLLKIESQQVFQSLSSRLQVLEEEQAKRLSFAVPKMFQGKTINDIKLANEEKVIALTFDDGPWPGTTNDVLYILDQYKIKATFFVVGRNVQNYPEITKKIVRHGHALGNHTWSHYYHYHNPSAASREIDNTTARVYKTTGVKMSLFRPPGGVLNNGLVAYASKQKQSVVMWSADSQDYRVSANALRNNVLKYADPGGIVLLHDGGGNRSRTVRALPGIIDELKNRGYRFVTVPELMEMKVKEVEASQQQN